MSKVVAVGLGEVLWDVLDHGRKLGGAPANFAFQVNSLGGRGLPVSRVGDDDLGREALQILRANDLDTACVTLDPDHPTGTVLAKLDAAGQANYVFPADVAWDFLTVNDAARRIAPDVDAVCFGTLAQRSAVSRAAVREFLGLAPAAALKVFDVNLRGDFYSRELIEESLGLATVLKVSDAELPVLAKMFELPGDDRGQLAALVQRFALDLAALTRGAAGSLLVARDAASDHPGLTTEVVDTIGAGDAFTAAMVLGICKGWSLGQVNERANQVAAFVCSQAGAMAVAPAELRVTGPGS